MDSKRLAGKSALVTGAAGGLGAAIAKALCTYGAKVVLTDLNSVACEDGAAKLRDAGYEAESIPLDVSDEESWKSAARHVEKAYGGLEVLVNNAGINTRETILQSSLESWRKTIDIDLTGAFLGMKYLAPLMKDRNASIVNISSTAGVMGHPDAAYTAAKWGLRGLSKAAALEFVGWGIRVNSVHPGSVPTGLHHNTPPGHAEVWRKLIPMARAGTPDEIAQVVSFLASDESSYMTGAEMVIDGGLSSCGVVAGRERLLAEYK